jgi:hypothetical protein
MWLKRSKNLKKRRARQPWSKARRARKIEGNQRSGCLKKRAREPGWKQRMRALEGIARSLKGATGTLVESKAMCAVEK